MTVMVKATKTLNPLHFEDLEPHRFEDLVRQLAYDFRVWSRIDAIGRTGADAGMDIRAMERVLSEQPAEPDEPSDGEEEPPEIVSSDRLWVIQCKRENALGPAKVKKVLEEFFKGEEKPYGYILAAACDFSKASRDAGAEILRANGVQEFLFWGKGELEDLLIQPKNDHLLFAYFGISLQIRRRSQRTDLRSKLALKRKLVKELGGIRAEGHKSVLIRDPKDEQYPWIRESEAFIANPAWRFWEFHSHQPPGHVAFVTKRRFAYVNWENEEWDFTKHANTAWPPQDLFGLDRESLDPGDTMQVARAFWELNVPEANRAFAYEVGIIEYERILLCDEIGDRFNEGPHLLVEFTPQGSPFSMVRSWIEAAGSLYDARRLREPDTAKRLSIFPKELPDEREKWHAELKRRVEELSSKGRSRT